MGKPMLQRVYEAAEGAKNLEGLIIATDDERILKAAKSFRAETWLTSTAHKSGTDRVAEVAKTVDSPLIVNIQVDEPLITGKIIDDLVTALQDETIPMATLAARTDDLSLLEEENIVKVVPDKKGFALYFSRAPLPYQASDYFLRHIGIYGYQKKFLISFTQMNPSRLEKTEDLEQLRALENGYRIKIIETRHSFLSVDSPEDIIKVEKFFNKESDD